MRLAAFLLASVLCVPLFAATLEKLSMDQMAQQATTIVRGRITGCSGEMRGVIIYTRCGVSVTETWKGTPAKKLEFVVPGGSARGLSQTFTGSPRFNANDQFVLFLWVGRSGTPQIIGLSQGVFDVSVNPTGTATVKRAASTETMLDASGKRVRDEAVEMSVMELRTQVDRALAGKGQK